MKKLLLFLTIIFAFALRGVAQQNSFAPQGAEWYFNVWGFMGAPDSFYHMEVLGDTLIQGHQCSVITGQFLGGNGDQQYVYEDNRVVYWYNQTMQAFTTLYDFDADEGDSWICEVDSCSFVVHVQSVEEVTWEGHTYRVQRVSSEGGVYYNDPAFNGAIIEGIGYERGLFPYPWACSSSIYCGGYTNYLRCYLVNDEMLYHGGDYECDAVLPWDYPCWDGTVAETYDGGDGTAENPYQIATPQQLALLAQQTNDGTGGDAYYILTNDICLNASLEMWYRNWIPIGRKTDSIIAYFRGSFDGNGKTISGLLCETNEIMMDPIVGLFGCTDGAEIANVNLSKCRVEGMEYAGGLVGYAGRTTILGCSIENSTVQCNEGRAGGLVGYMGTPYHVTETNGGDACIIDSCQVAVSVEVRGMKVGGVVAESNVNLPLTLCVVRNCENYGSIATTTGGASGGIGGWMIYSHIENCINHGSVVATSWAYAGGVVGFIRVSSVYDCCNDGDISSSNISGGIIGVTNPLQPLEVIDTVLFVRNCHNDGEVFVNQNTTTGCAGGIIGWLLPYGMTGFKYFVFDCSNHGNVLCEGEVAGGIVGKMLDIASNTCFLMNVYNTGNVYANESCAGIATTSDNRAVWRNVYNAGMIGGDAENKGSIIAYQENVEAISDCYWLFNEDYSENGAEIALQHSCAFHPTTYYAEWSLDSLQFGHDLVQALNAGAEQIEGLYPEVGNLSRWGYDVEEVNNGFPVLVPNNSEDDALEAYCEAPFNFGGSPIYNQGTCGAQLWWNKPFASHWFHYDENPYAGSTVAYLWGIRIPGEEIHAGDMLTHVAFYKAGCQNEAAQFDFAFSGGETEPENLEFLAWNSVLVEPGPDEWVMVKLRYPIHCQGGKSLWIVMDAPFIADYKAPYCQSSGNPDARWASLAGGYWYDYLDEVGTGGDWMIRGYFTNDVGYNDPGYNEDLDHYNIYRGSSLDELEKIAEVGRDEEEYFDTLQSPFGDYYYQLTASYTDGRESAPAKRSENPHSPDYVYFHVGNISSLGSEWYYEIQKEDGGITYQHLVYAADTTVNDKEVKIIIRTNTLYDKGKQNEVTREYIYEDFGKVYWWNETIQDFTILYDLGAQIGDEWMILVGTESIIMHVDTVEQYEYEGATYRTLHVSDADNLFSGEIMSGIGHLTSFFPERLMNRGKNYRVEGIRCYWREGELVFKYGDRDCDEVYQEYHNGIEEDGPSAGSGTLTVYPNPTHSVLFVETRRATSLQAETYRITNLMGQTLMTGTVTTEVQRIDVSNLSEGMYFITVGDATRKFVVR